MTAGRGIRVEIRDAVAIVTLDRPEVRNALNGSLLVALSETMTELDRDPAVDVVVLTGADPAFCAGLDLKALGAGDPDLLAAVSGASHPPWPPTTKPVVGAINGPAVTGGLELALACDLLVASTRATFADTHARVGVMPGWQLTVRLPAVVGRRLATWMSLTGRPLNAAAALAAGLVVQVVEHDSLLDTSLRLGRDIAENDQAAVQTLLAAYRLIENDVMAVGFAIETANGQAWRAGHGSLTDVESRRAEIIRRGSRLHSPPLDS